MIIYRVLEHFLKLPLPYPFSTSAGLISHASAARRSQPAAALWRHLRENSGALPTCEVSCRDRGRRLRLGL